MPQYGSIRESGDDLGDFIFSRGGAAPPDQGDVPPIVDYHEQQGRNDTIAVTDSLDAQAQTQAINLLVEQYRQAYILRDSKALWKIWPNPAKQKKKDIELAFNGASAINMNVQAVSSEVSGDGTRATIKGLLSETYTPKGRSAQSFPNQDIIFQLSKIDGNWVIVDVQ
jgi:hypothetical protein